MTKVNRCLSAVLLVLFAEKGLTDLGPDSDNVNQVGSIGIPSLPEDKSTSQDATTETYTTTTTTYSTTTVTSYQPQVFGYNISEQFGNVLPQSVPSPLGTSQDTSPAHVYQQSTSQNEYVSSYDTTSTYTTTIYTTTTTYSSIFKSNFQPPSTFPSFGASLLGQQKLLPFTMPHGANVRRKKSSKLTMDDFERHIGLLHSMPAQPEDVRRQFMVSSREIQELSDVSRRWLFAKLHQQNIGPDACPQRPQPKCDPHSKIRTYDGVCNNLKQPFWGSFLHPVGRFLDPEYEDGLILPRGSLYDLETGYTSRLPNPRKISSVFHAKTNISDDDRTHMLMQFGQLIDHDIIAIPKSDFDCCHDDTHRLCACFSIDVVADEFFSGMNRTCMHLTRSSVNCRSSTSWAEQFNGVTSFIDASTVYGSDAEKAVLLRGGEDRRRDGKLWTLSEGKGLGEFKLPQRSDLNMPAYGKDKSTDFVAGDTRAMSQPLLLSTHNVWLLEHNFIAEGILKAAAGGLDRLDPKIRDEVIFQEARRIVIAQMQHFVYVEMLPALLNDADLDRHELRCPRNSAYKDDLDPTIRNEFGTAVFRFGHSVVQDVFEGRSQPWKLSSGLSDPHFAVKDSGTGFENEIAGSCSQTMLNADRFVTQELSNKLFANKKIIVGPHEEVHKAASDLVSINIQRGRDHGLANYNSARKLVGLDPIAAMGERPQEIGQENWDILAGLYSSPDDIDLFTGGLAEDHKHGGLLGPTFSWFIGEQFRHLKSGDRFFFTHTEGENARGLPENLQEMIHKRSLSDVFCENVKSLGSVQNKVMLRESSSNPTRPCGDASRGKIDFEALVSHILQELDSSTGVNHPGSSPQSGGPGQLTFDSPGSNDLGASNSNGSPPPSLLPPPPPSDHDEDPFGISGPGK